VTVWDVGISLSIDWSHRDVRFNESTMSVRLRANRLNRVPSSWIVCPFRTLPHRFRRVQAGNCFGDPVIATANRRVADFLIAKRRTESLALAGNRVLVTGAGNPILDIGPLLAEPDVSIASLKTFAKLLTSARLEQGELCTLTGREWNEIWNRLRD
jgi:antitoxin (DNA-binding transcriptional repressor) of toxin-antitoxin stability system